MNIYTYKVIHYDNFDQFECQGIVFAKNYTEAISAVDDMYNPGLIECTLKEIDDTPCCELTEQEYQRLSKEGGCLINECGDI